MYFRIAKNNFKGSKFYLKGGGKDGDKAGKKRNKKTVYKKEITPPH